MTETEELLVAYVDGELPAGRVAEVEELLAHDASARRFVEAMRETNALLRAACAETFYADGAPELLPARGPVQIGRRRLGWVAAAAACAVAFAGGAVTYGLWTTGEDSWLDEIAEYHRVFSRQGIHLVELRADQRVAIEDWFHGLLDRRIVIPSELPGLSFAGARLLVIEGKPVADLLYTRADGPPIGLCLMRRAGRPAPVRAVERDGLRMAVWRDEAFAYVVVGEIEAARAVALAATAARQMQT